MKSAISLQADILDAASRCADQLGISRSEFFATAARRYLDELDRRSMTEHIDAVLAGSEPDQSAEDTVAAGHACLATSDDW